MSSTQQPKALQLAELCDKYRSLEKFGAELRSQYARIAELEALLATGGQAQAVETLRAELADETEAADNWRRLALQFDNHRMQALGHLKAILHPDSSVDEYKAAELFLKAPPLDGEAVLAQRIAALAAQAKQGGAA